MQKIDNSVIVNKKERKLYIEALRIIAIYFVIFNHTNDWGFMLFTVEKIGSIDFWIDLFFSIFCKFAVPMFFCISGVFIEKYEDISFSKLFLKKILKYIIVIFALQLFYYLVYTFEYNSQFKFNEYISSVFANKNPVWQFLYTYIAFLLSAPLLAKLIKNSRNNNFVYIIVLAIVFNSFLPVLEYLFVGKYISINKNFIPSWIFNNIVMYPCIGYYLGNRMHISKKKIFVLWIINILTILLSCYLTYKKGIEINEWSEAKSQTFHNTFVLFNVITIFVSIKYLFEHINISTIIEKVIVALGSATFGVYLLHLFVKDKIVEFINDYQLIGIINIAKTF